MLFLVCIVLCVFADKAHKVPYKTELANFCLEMVASVGPGNHVLTLVATSSLRVELAYVLMP